MDKQLPTASDAAACSACVFWKRHKPEPFGQCKRNPPQVVPQVETYRDAYSNIHVKTVSVTEFPNTYPDCNCGEFVPHNAAHLEGRKMDANNPSAT